MITLSQIEFYNRPLIFIFIQVYKTVLAACNQEEIELPILEVRDVKKVSLVLVTGDRGLCGSYNSAVIKAATRRIVKLTEQGIQVSFNDNSVIDDNLIKCVNMSCLFIIIIDSVGSSW